MKAAICGSSEAPPLFCRCRSRCGWFFVVGDGFGRALLTMLFLFPLKNTTCPTRVGDEMSRGQFAKRWGSLPNKPHAPRLPLRPSGQGGVPGSLKFRRLFLVGAYT